MTSTAVGIDLGTTYSAIAALNPAGFPEIITDDDGEKLTASAVLVNGESILVGELALEQWPGYPDLVARDFKRRLHNLDWKAPQGDPRFGAVDLSSLVLRKLKQSAEYKLGKIKSAVITVPAYFDESRRQAVMLAGQQAGLEVLAILNEPTAAALAYLDSGAKPGKILVFDLGGGTFDVTVAEISNGTTIEVLAIGGDNELGGIEFDRAIAVFVDGEFGRRNDGLSATDDLSTWAQLELDAKKAKHGLSKLQSVKPSLTFKGRTESVELTREKFEELISPFIARTKACVENTLDEINLEPSDIDEVVLVGGSTRIPAVQQMIRGLFGKDGITPVHVDEAVVLGAAIKAAMLTQDQSGYELSPAAVARVENIAATDVISKAIGTTCESNGRIINDILIPINTPLPCSITRSYFPTRDGQEAIRCDVTEATTNDSSDPEFVTTLLDENLKVPSGQLVSDAIEVTFSVDENGRAHFRFRDIRSKSTLDRTMEVGQKTEREAQDACAIFDDLRID
jgi:molecular chaperone DnaK